MTKFSVLIPTRNRVELLQYAVQSVLRQDYENWEIIISDNFSDQDVAGYVSSLNDERVRYYRTDSFVSVTANWNNCMRHATGDYVIMIGDDDCLMRGFFSIINTLIGRFDQPDYIYTDANIFGYPGVLPGFPNGFLRRQHNENYFGTREPFLLDRASAIKIVRDSFSFKMSAQHNIQMAIFRRAFCESLVQPFFQSPFPDYYAIPTAFLTAQTIVIYQQPVVTVGISSNSFGSTHFNDKPKAGATILNNAFTLTEFRKLESVILPGTYELNGWLIVLHTIEINYAEQMRSNHLEINSDLYRTTQIDYVYRGHLINGIFSASELRELESHMTDTERRQYGLFRRLYYRILGLVKKFLPLQGMRILRRLSGKWSSFDDQRKAVTGYNTILDVFERLPPTYDA